MQNTKTYDIMNGTETVKNKPGIAPVSVPWQNNTYAFDPLGDVNKKYFTSKADDYKDNQYKEDHQKSKAETKALQETLNKNGYTDSNNKPLVVDGIFGPNTEYAYNNAVKNNWKNLSSQFDIERDEISSAVDKAYASIIEKADNRKLSMSPDEIKQVQQFLNDQGYTDLQGKTLVVDGILGDRTKYAFEKYIQEDTPKTEVIELQKKLNELGITDSDQNPLVIDGKLGKKTDSAVKNAVTKYGKTADKNSKQGEKKNNKTLDKVSDFLVWASLIPGLDTLSNLAAIPVDLLRGDYISAALSAAAMLPYVGEAADAAKLARMADKTVDMAKVVGKAGKTADAINSSDTIIDTFNAAKKITNAADVTDDIGDTLKVLEKGTDAGKGVDNTIGTAEVVGNATDIEKLSLETSTIAKRSPIKIPAEATAEVQAKNGYSQIKYVWESDGYKYTSRWHTRTPNAPVNQGTSWVVERRIPGVGYGRNYREPIKEVLVGNNEWITWTDWRNAIKARKNGTITKIQEEWLDNGHWKD